MKIRGMAPWKFALRCLCFPVFLMFVILDAAFSSMASLCEYASDAIDGALPK